MSDGRCQAASPAVPFSSPVFAARQESFGLGSIYSSLAKSNVIHLLILLLATVLSGLWALELDHGNTWDLRNYHYYAGYSFLNKPFNYDFAPAQIQSFLNPLLHVPSYLMIRHWPPELVTFFLGALHGVNLFLIFEISFRLFDYRNAWLRYLWSLMIAATGFCGAVNISELGTTFSDNTVSILVLFCLLLIIRGYPDAPSVPGTFTRPFGIGCIAGLAVGIKLTSAIYVLPLAASVAIVSCMSWGWVRSLKPIALLCCGIGVGFVAVYGAWGWNLYREYGNPFFPYFNEIFQSDYYRTASAADPGFLPRDWSQQLFYPLYWVRTNVGLVAEVSFRDVRVAIAYLAVVAMVLFRFGYAFPRMRLYLDRFRQASLIPARTSVILLTSFVVLSYLLWQMRFSIYRYAVVLEFLAPLYVALAIAYLTRSKVFTIALGAAANLVMIWTLKPLDFGGSPLDSSFFDIRVPSAATLDQSVVLMAGGSPFSYVVPSFPSPTRFVRVESNFIRPGVHDPVDGYLRELLSAYPKERRWAYVHRPDQYAATPAALSFYGLQIKRDSCTELRSSKVSHGYLCKVRGPYLIRARPDGTLEEAFAAGEDYRDVQLEVSPKEIVAGRDVLRLRVSNLEASEVDVLYSIDGSMMPPVLFWKLDEKGSASVPVGKATSKGRYRYRGIRDARLRKSDSWIPIDIEVMVK